MAIFVMKFVIEDMAETQRIARIEFVNKLLVANGFLLGTEYPHLRFYKETHIGQMRVIIVLSKFVQLESYRLIEIIPHDQPLNPLRDFIKLSNQK